MKITGITAFAVSVPARRAHPMAFGGEKLGRYVIVEVATDEGITGLGEATVLLQWGGDHGRYFGESPVTTIHITTEVIAPAVQGMDPLQREAIHRRMNQAVKGYPYAKCAVDLALHDIAGKAFGVPVYQLLGGLYRRGIPIAHSLGILDEETMQREAAAAVEDGVRTIKVKIGLDPERDVAAVRLVRQTVGDSIDIVVDANQGYATPKLAITTLRRLEEFGIRYAEQPVEGLHAMAQVAAAVDVPIMADESAWNVHDLLDIIEAGAADAISIYTTKPGGLLPAKKVAAVAEAAGLPCNVNGSAETGVGNAGNLHLACSTPCVTEACVLPITTLAGREQTKLAGQFYVDDIISEPFKFVDGCLEVPDRPGLGIELDRTKVAKYRIA
jgi:muconate cycloisomerase